jgi:hypothetical protein
MTVDQVYSIIQYATAKNTANGYISPDDFNNVLMPVAQDGYLDYLLGEYQKYQPTRPFSPVAFSGNQKIRTSIAPLIYSVVLPIDSTTGIADYPSDFEQVDAMNSLYNIYRIRFSPQDKLWSNYRSVIDPVTTNPIYYMNEYGFNFLPATVGNARMSYVRKPPPIHWGYDLDGDGIPVYNAALSQQPIWGETDIFQIIVRALALVGVNLQLGTVQQYAEAVKQGGQ